MYVLTLTLYVLTLQTGTFPFIIMWHLRHPSEFVISCFTPATFTAAGLHSLLHLVWTLLHELTRQSSLLTPLPLCAEHTQHGLPCLR